MGIGWKRLSGGAESFTGDVRGTHRADRPDRGRVQAPSAAEVLSAPAPTDQKRREASLTLAPSPHRTLLHIHAAGDSLSLSVTCRNRAYSLAPALGQGGPPGSTPPADSVRKISVSSRCSPAYRLSSAALHSARLASASSPSTSRLIVRVSRVSASSGCPRSATPPLFSGRPRFLRRCRLSPGFRGDRAGALVAGRSVTPIGRRRARRLSFRSRASLGASARWLGISDALLYSTSVPTSGRWASVDTFGRNRCKIARFWRHDQ